LEKIFCPGKGKKDEALVEILNGGFQYSLERKQTNHKFRNVFEREQRS